MAIKGWRKTRDANFPDNILFISSDEETTLEVSPDFEPPFKSKRPSSWMFSVWKNGNIIRKHNKVFKSKSQAISYAKRWMRKHPNG